MKNVHKDFFVIQELPNLCNPKCDTIMSLSFYLQQNKITICNTEKKMRTFMSIKMLKCRRRWISRFFRFNGKIIKIQNSSWSQEKKRKIYGKHKLKIQKRMAKKWSEFWSSTSQINEYKYLNVGIGTWLGKYFMIILIMIKEMR